MFINAPREDGEPDFGFTYFEEPDAQGNLSWDRVVPNGRCEFLYTNFLASAAPYVVDYRYFKRELKLTPGADLKLTFGGGSATLEGKVAIPKGSEETYLWSSATARLVGDIEAELGPRPKQPIVPGVNDSWKYFEVRDVQGEERRIVHSDEKLKEYEKLYEAWVKTDAGKAATKPYTEYFEKAKKIADREYQVPVGKDGAVQFTGVEPGKYKLTVRVPRIHGDWPWKLDASSPVPVTAPGQGVVIPFENPTETNR